jgi:hypothetical protein
MVKRASISLGLTLIFITSILIIDWLYIFTIQQQAPIINHWVVALPITIPLFFSLTMLSLIGIYLVNQWGFILAYFTIILSMFFSLISYESFTFTQLNQDIQFISLILLNIVIFVYVALYNIHTSNNK